MGNLEITKEEETDLAEAAREQIMNSNAQN